MSKSEKSRKPLIIGIIAAVVILAVLLVLLLTQCTGGSEGTATTAPGATTTPSEEVPTYELYWNADRAEYDGKSEAGMSSRMPEADGYFHVRFILDGEEVVLKVQDRKLINAIDVQDLMGLEFDENGVVVGVVDIDDMPLEKMGWQFYVQSAARTLIKLNSSESMNGMEVLLEIGENTGVYDMSGKSGPVGVTTEAINLDRVYAVANLAGEVTHVFIYQRPNYMLTHEAECQHCKEVVTWYEWVKEDAMPLETGHYQLMNDIQLTGQPAQKEDAKVCIDLNGQTVTGKSGTRCYAMFNAGTELAIMDTSEDQSGRMVAHGTGDQGMVVWVRYGAFYLYGGTLDASKATCRLNGTAIEVGKGKFFYMYGGEIIGGKAQPRKNDKGQWTAGLGGTMYIGGKFVMNGGVIRDGYAEAVITKYNADGTPNTYSRGIGGNIYAGSGAEIEINGGTIKNGRAGNTGANIYLDGTATLTLNDGIIYGGVIKGNGRNGGNLFVTSKATVTQNGGSILAGGSRNCGGNVYLNGKYVMNGGVIADGVIRNYKTNKVTANAPSANVFNVNGKFHMYGGFINGGVQAIDTSATDTRDTQMVLSGFATIDGGEHSNRNLTLSSGGSGISVYVGQLRDSAKIGVHATTGYFTLPTKEENKDNFFSDIEGADILYHDGRLALGQLLCICGSNSDNVEDHLGACKDAGGEKLVFAPWLSGTSMPNTHGNYYLLAESLSVANTSVVTPGDGKGSDVVLNVDLNGKKITSKSGRFYSLFENKVSKDENGNYLGDIADEHIELSLSDSVGTAKVTLNARSSSDMGYLVWGRYADSVITIYGGEFDGSLVSATRHSGAIISVAGELNMYGGKISGGHSSSGGIIIVNGSKAVFNMYDGTIENGTADHSGGNVYVHNRATMNMYGGTIRGGSINADGNAIGDLGYGGNVCVNANSTLNMYGGTITDGLVKIGMKGVDASGVERTGGGGLAGNLQVNGTANLYGGLITRGRAGTGGNVGTNSASALINIQGDAQITKGVATGGGGNLAVNVRGNNGITIGENALIAEGEAGTSGGNIMINAWAANGKDASITMNGGTIRDGLAANNGGNIYMHNSTSGDTAGKAIIVMNGGQILGGRLEMTNQNGGSIFANGRSEFTLNDGLISGGGGAKQGGNFLLNASTTLLTVNGGKIVDGSTNDCGGNVHLKTNATLVVNGGFIGDGCNEKGGYGPSNNVYSVNGNVVMTGGEIKGLAVTNTTANGTTTKLSGDAVISATKNGQGLNLGIYPQDTAMFDAPMLELGELSDKASIAISTGNFVSLETVEGNVAKFHPTIADAGAHFVDNRVFIGQVKCVCGGTANIGPCAEGGHIKVPFAPWNGTKNTLRTDGNYYLLNNVTVGTQITIGHDETRPMNVVVDLNGHTMTSTFRIFQTKNGASLTIADHKGGGAILSKGNVNDNYGLIQNITNTDKVIIYSGSFGMAEGYKPHKSIALAYVGGIWDVYGGEFFGGEQPTGTLLQVAGTFNLHDGVVRDGYNAAAGDTSGNFTVTGALNVYGGTISGGRGMRGGNIFAKGKVNLYGGTVTSGVAHGNEAYGQGGNIHLTGSNACLNADGDVLITKGEVSSIKDGKSTWAPGGNIYANGGAQIILDGGATVSEGKGSDGHNIYMTADSTEASLRKATVHNTSSDSANISVERGTLTIDGAVISNEGENARNIFSNENTKVAKYYMKSGLITGGTNGNIRLSGDDTFTMTGGVIEKGTATSGGNIQIINSSVFNLEGGLITGGKATNGGNILIDGTNCVLNISGGELAGGSSTGNHGGNILMWGNNSTINISGGLVTGGNSSKNGGNIAVGATHTMNLSGGTVKGGYAGDSGGNIVCYGKLVMTGGTVTDGVSKNAGNGMNISVIKSADNQLSTLELSGGTIAGGLHFNNATGKVNVTISGNPVVDKELTSADATKPTYSMKLASNDITVGTLTEGARIMVSGQDGIFSLPAPEGSDKYFISEVDGMAVWQIDGELVLVYGRNSCVCGVNSDNPDDHIGDCDGEKHNWLPVTELPATSGYYYLISDVTDSGAQRIIKGDTVQNIFLDLNGKTVTSNRGRMYRLDTTNNLTFTDNSAARDGKIVISGTHDQGAGVWFFGGNSTFTMYAGTFDARTATIKTNSPGLVLAGGTGTFKLYGGTILGGKSTENCWGGTAVALESNKTHILGDVLITSEENSAIYVNNAAKIDLTHVTEAPETPWAVEASGIFTKGWNSSWDIDDYFVAASDGGGQIYLDEATGELKLGKFYCVCGQAEHIGDCNGDLLFWRPWPSSGTLPQSTGNWYLLRDVVGGDKGLNQTTLNNSTKQTIRLDLAGNDIKVNKDQRVFSVEKANELTITDSVGGGVIYGGGLTGDTASGGVIITANTAVLNIYGGTITLRDDAPAAGRGSLLYIRHELNLHGGKLIANHNANGASAVIITDNKTFNMTGGEITITEGSNSKISNLVNLWTGAKLNISGGTLRAGATNVRTLVTAGPVVMTGGLIENGKVTTSDNGANVSVAAKGSFTMTGGIVRGGNAANQGGNFAVYGTLKVGGTAVITDGVAKGSQGHNISVIKSSDAGPAILEVSGGQISGGIYFNNYTGDGTLKLSGKPVIDQSLTSASAASKPGYGVIVSKTKGGDGNMLLDVTGLTGGKIYVTGHTAGQFAKNATSGMENYFVSQTYEGDTLLPVCYDNGGLYFGKVYCLCGASETGGTHSQGCLAENDGKELIWIPASSLSDLQPGGNYYLTQDLSSVDMLTVSNSFTLDLNGHSVTKSDGQRIFSFNGAKNCDVIVTDTSAAKTGKIVVSGRKTNQGGLFWLASTNSLRLVGGTFDASGYTLSASAGGRSGAGIDAPSDTLINIYDGVTFKGGKVIMDNTQNSAFGGGIATSGTLNIFGGTITGGQAVRGGNIRGGGTSVINISGGRIENGTAIGETVEGFSKVYVLGGNIHTDGVLNITGGTITGGRVEKGTQSNWSSAGNIYVGKTLKITGGTVSNGYSVSQAGNIYASGSATVTISGGTITGGQGTQGGNFYLDKGTDFTVTGGTISNGTSTSHGGNIFAIGACDVKISGGKVMDGTATGNGGNIYAVYTGEALPTVTLGKATISGGTSSSNGGNISLIKGELTMNGTTVTDGQAKQGGNLVSDSTSVVTLTDATITGGVATQGAGGNFLLWGSTKATATNLKMADGVSVAVLNADNNVAGGTGGNIHVAVGTTFTLVSGQITGGTADCSGVAGDGGYGGSIRVLGTFNMQGGTVSGGYVRNGKAGGGLGGNFCVGGVLNITGGTVSDGDAVTGGNIGTNSTGAVLRISNATIQHGEATGVGGNLAINVRNCKEFTLKDCQILGGKAGSNGGNIAITVGASGGKPTYSMSVSGCTVKNGTAASNGGNIYVKGVNDYRTHLFLENTTVTGGTGTGTGRGGVYMQDAYSTITLNGKVVIDGNTGTNLWLGGASLKVTANELTAGSKIGLDAGSDRVVSNVVTDTEAGYFYSQDENRNLYHLDDGTLYLGQMHCICGKPDGSCTTYTDASGKTVGCDGTVLTWKPWTATDTLPTDSGNWYLTADVSRSSTQALNKNVVLDLNGYTVTLISNRMYTIGEGGGLTITNTGSTGGIVVDATKDGSYAGAGVAEVGGGATMNLYGVSITRKSGYATYAGGLIQVGTDATTGTLNIFGDTVISGGHSKNMEGENAGNLRVKANGTVNMYDGQILDGVAKGYGDNIYLEGVLNIFGDARISNSAVSKKSGNILAWGIFAQLNMYGGTITGDISTSSNPTITMQGNAQITEGGANGLAINDIRVVVQVTGALTGAQPIAITHATATPPRAFAVGSGYTLTYADKASFVSTRDDLQIGFFQAGEVLAHSNNTTTTLTADSLCMVAVDAHMHCECGGLLAEDAEHKCYDVIFQALTTSDSKMYDTTSKTGKFAGNYYIPETESGEFSMAGTSISIRHDAHVRICMNGQTLTSNTRTISVFCDGTDGINCNHKDDVTFVANPQVVLTSCKEGGAVASEVTNADIGRAVWQRFGDVTVYGLTLDASATKTNTGNKSGLAFGADNGTAKLYDVTLKGGLQQDVINGLGSTMVIGKMGIVEFHGSLTIDNGEAQDLYIQEGGIADVTNLTSVNDTICVGAAGTFTKGYSTCAISEDLFTAYTEGENIVLLDGELFSGKYTCYCGATDGNHKPACLAASGETDPAKVEPVAFKSWHSTTSFPTSGNYVLIADIPSIQGRLPDNGATLAVDLNGHSITSSGTSRMFSFLNRDQSTLIITDLSAAKTGKIVVKSNADDNTNQGALIWLRGEGNKVYMINGTWDASAFSAKGSSAIHVESAVDCLLHIDGATVKGVEMGSSKSNGSVMSFRTSGCTGNTVIMEEGSSLIATSSTISNGGAVYLAGAADGDENTFIMNGGTITGTTVSESGGTLVVYNATFVMNGGTIQGGKALKGGNIYATTGGFVTINGGTVKGGQTSGENGGNIYLNNGSKLTLNGPDAKIQDGKSANTCGNICAANGSEFIMNDGQISGGQNGEGKVVTSANVGIIGTAKFTMNGGTIDGHIAAATTSATNTPTILLDKDAVINPGDDGKGLALSLQADAAIKPINIGTLTSEASITITALDKNFAAGDVIAENVSSADRQRINLNEEFWYSNHNSATGQITLVAK